MPSFLRKLIGKKTITGLDFNSQHMGIVQLSVSAGRPEISYAESREFQNPDQIRDELLSFNNKNPGTLVTAIPSFSAMIREIPISFDNPKRLEQIVKYQAEPYIPLHIDDVIVDFLPCSNKDRIWTVAVPKETLSTHLENLAAAGLNPVMVGLTDLALYFLYLHAVDRDSENPVAVILFDQNRTSIQVFDGGYMDFFRVMDGGADDIEAVNETLELYSLKKAGQSIEKILLTGSSALQEGISDKVHNKTGIETELWHPFDHFKNASGAIDTERQARLAVPLGLALMFASSFPKTINLRKEAYALEKDSHLRRKLVYAVSAICLFTGMFTFYLYQNIYQLEKKHNRLSREIREVFQRTFPDVTYMVKGQESVQMGQKIEEEKSSFMWLEAVSSEGKALEAILALTNVISRYPDVTLENISFDEKAIHLDGQASSFKTVDNLEGGLSKSKPFRGAKLMSAKMDNQEKVVQFQFVIKGNNEVR